MVQALPPVVRGDTGIVHELREGWGEFRSRTWLWVIVLAFSMLNAIQSGVIGVVGAMPIGMIAYGWLATAVPLEPLLVVSGVAYATIALSTLGVSSIRRMEQVAEKKDAALAA